VGQGISGSGRAPQAAGGAARLPAERRYPARPWRAGLAAGGRARPEPCCAAVVQRPRNAGSSLACRHVVG